MPPSVPIATYRLQLSAKFGFAQAAALVPYLRDLGISHIYASPFLKSRVGSTHGYDIVDHNQLDPELGGDAGFSELSSALETADMGLILDFVPNHMGIGKSDNPWWLDVLEYGPASPYAETFDIDWDLLPFRTHAGVLLPILGEPYGQALESGEIVLRYDGVEGSFSAWYYDHRLPIRPDRYPDIVTTVLGANDAAETPTGQALLAALEGRASLRRDALALKAALAAVPGGAEMIEAGLHVYSPRDDQPRRAATLHRLLERQYYRLAHWRVAVSDINYRRFFDINDLAGIRVERSRTFRAVHQLVFRLIAEGRLHGIRLDHIDGLYDPALYCRQLRRGMRANRNGKSSEFYTVVEKILAEGENLPPLVGVAGTTGYDALNDIARLLLDPSGLSQLDQTLAEVTGENANFPQIVAEAKRLIINQVLASEFRVLVQLLARIAAGHWSSRDFTLDRLQAALESYVVNFPVYRTYLTGRVVSETDRALIERTVVTARSQWTGPDADIFSFLRDVLTLDLIHQVRSGYSHARVRRFTMKLQQFTGPVMAKAMEDTAFYRYHRLLALNEVGGEPAAPALSLAEFHASVASRHKKTPRSMIATSTHDTKRGEDARMRILALSELADEWRTAVAGWTAHYVSLGAPDMPSQAHRYMVYQALIGAWPLAGIDCQFIERMQAYARKAAREGKLETSWANPNDTYEKALMHFVETILDPVYNRHFLDSFSEFAERAALLGALNSLSQLTLKLTLPGVPDIYHGTEAWDLSLVDPDNRRPVDFGLRKQALAALPPTPQWLALCANWSDGAVKVALMQCLLMLRSSHADLFTKGQYRPIQTSGSDGAKIVAFARTLGETCAIIVAARHFYSATDGGRRWMDVHRWDTQVALPDRKNFRNVLGPDTSQIFSGQFAAATLLGPLPVAALIADRD